MGIVVVTGAAPVQRSRIGASVPLPPGFGVAVPTGIELVFSSLRFHAPIMPKADELHRDFFARRESATTASVGPMSLDLLDPDCPDLTPVSPKLATLRRMMASAWLLPPLLVSVALALLLHPLWWFIAGVFAVILLWVFWLIGRRVSAHRYLEDADDMIIASGRWWRSVTVVPYGRIQFIDIDESPLLRLFGLATVKLNTASATSDAQLTGLPRAEARALRERLSGRARERMAGL